MKDHKLITNAVKKCWRVTLQPPHSAGTATLLVEADSEANARSKAATGFARGFRVLSVEEVPREVRHG